jgi:hypothetical protein
MELSKYIDKVGDAAFAQQFGIRPRTAMSYRLKERQPRPKLANKIIAETPVTWRGIYAAEESSGRA